MIELTLIALLSLAAFAGAVVSGMTGFAFSAVAGAVLLHALPPVQTVTLMIACSIPVQCASLLGVRGHLNWHPSLALIAGGVLGVAPAVYLLHHVEPTAFRIGFGVFIAAYALYMLCRPAVQLLRSADRGRCLLVGIGGGLVGGLTAMPGALPTIWSQLRGLDKTQQRALVQPFIIVMQLVALTLILLRDGLAPELMMFMLISLPGLAAGTLLGLMLFRRINESTFRRAVLAVLFCSGVGLLI